MRHQINPDGTAMNRANFVSLLVVTLLEFAIAANVCAQDTPDFLRQMQFEAVDKKKSDWVHWGDKPSRFSSWTNHSNRLVPVYTFGIGLDEYKGSNSCYRSEEKLKAMYGEIPDATLNPEADYFDQTDIFRLQMDAIAAGKKNIVLMIFDGMDWQTSQAAAIYRNKKVMYEKGRGSGLHLLDYGVDQGITDYGFFVCSPHNNGTKTDVNGQVVKDAGTGKRGGYSAELGGRNPWSKAFDATYLIGKNNELPHIYTDSAASATSMFSGVKTYNSSINVDSDGKPIVSFPRKLQENGVAIGIVTSVPISHATPAASYAVNVSRNDYQDISRDLLGLPSIYHRENPLPGVDVLIGCGWGEKRSDDRKKQGTNYVSGNKYIPDEDIEKIDVENGGKYVVAQRTEGESGAEVLSAGAKRAAENGNRFFGFFGTYGGHLPYQTADGKFDPTRGKSRADRYNKEDVNENPTLAEMTSAALDVLSKNEKGFWLMVEAGDVDWANHNNNIDDSIGAVFSGDDAFKVVTDWVEKNSNWEETVVVVTADHGHMMVLDDLTALTGPRPVQDEDVESEELDSAGKPKLDTDSIEK